MSLVGGGLWSRAGSAVFGVVVRLTFSFAGVAAFAFALAFGPFAFFFFSLERVSAASGGFLGHVGVMFNQKCGQSFVRKCGRP